MRIWIGLILLSWAFGSVAAVPKANQKTASRSLRSCLLQVRDDQTPGERDRFRKNCFEKLSQTVSVPECVRTTNLFEYSIYSEEAKSFCLFKDPARVNVKNCVITAKALQYGENKDELLWSCIKETSHLKNKKACFEMSRQMVFPAFRQRATSYCASEL